MQLPFRVDLDGRVAVVTGGAGVLGAELAAALAHCGAKVAIVDVNPGAAEELAVRLRADGLQGLAVAADVLDRTSLRAAAEQIQAAFGPCDLLLNAAGGNHPSGTTSQEFLTLEDLDDASLRSFFSLDADSIERVFGLNFLGTLLPTQIFARQMLGRPGGCIINISSLSATRPLTKVPAYSAAKAAVSNFTAWLAVHLAPVGIRVNALAPGFFLTAQNRPLLIDPASGELSPRARKIIAHTPLGRFGEPRELVGTLLWLASGAASGFVSGAVIPVDGGFGAYCGV